MSGSNSLPPAAPAEAERPEPLTMTVHSLPSVHGEPQLRSPAEVRSGRIKLLLLFLVAASPVIASYFTYYVIRPEGRRNYGELVEQRALPTWTGTQLQGQTMSLGALKHQWLLISVADSACDGVCQRHLYLQRQLREGLGKEKDKLDWVWLHTGTGDVPDALKPALSSATVLRVNAEQLATWLQPAAGLRLSDHLYVVDPMGNWMMRFPANVDPKRAKRDLDRLVRAASFWDQPGRPTDVTGVQ
jgi:hypothetical protein